MLLSADLIPAAPTKPFLQDAASASHYDLSWENPQFPASEKSNSGTDSGTQVEGILSGLITEDLLPSPGDEPVGDGTGEQLAAVTEDAFNEAEKRIAVASASQQSGSLAGREVDLNGQELRTEILSRSSNTLSEQLSETLRAANGPPVVVNDYESHSVAGNAASQIGDLKNRQLSLYSIESSEDEPDSMAIPALVNPAPPDGSPSDRSSRVLRPGNSPGLMTFDNPEIWSASESYEWEINDLNGKEGPVPASPGWDLIEVNASLTVQSTTNSRFTLKLATNDVNSPQPLAGFDNTKSYTWRIVKTKDGIIGFDRSKIQIDATLFKNFLGSGVFALDIANGEHDLLLRFLPNSPSANLDASPSWTEQGPWQIQSSEPKEGVISGAVGAIAVHPFNPGIIFVGAVNGGVWRTENGTAQVPAWTPLGQHLPSLAAGALALSPFDRLGNPVGPNTPVLDLVLYVGTGSFSSTSIGVSRLGAAGVFKSTNGGNTWTATGTSTTSAILGGFRISSILPSPTDKDMVVVGTADASTLAGGLYKTSDGGGTWVRLSGTNDLGYGSVTDIRGDPGSLSRFYVALAGKFDSDLDGSFDDERSGNVGNGIYRTDDFGITWKRVDSGIRTADDFDNTDTDGDGKGDQEDGREGLKRSPNIKLAVSPVKPAQSDNPVFAVVIGTDNRPAGVFRSANAGGHWIPLGSRPSSHGGGQGLVHLSLVADPVDPDVVYIGGDITISVWRGDVSTAGLITFSLTSTDPNYGPGLKLPFVPVSVMDGTANANPPLGAGAGNARGLELPLGKIDVVQSDGVTVVTNGGAPDSYTIVLPEQPTIDLRVNIKAPSGIVVEDGAKPANEYLTFTAANWNVPQTVLVRASGIGSDPPPRRGWTIEHTVVPADPEKPDHLNFKLPEVPVTVLTPSSPGITVLREPDLSVSESAPAPKHVVVILNQKPTANVRINLIVNIQVTAVDAKNPGNAYLDFTPDNWDAGQRVLIAAVQDGVAEPDTWRSMQLGDAHGTASHPDSRTMVVDSNGDILEGDDGGIYRLKKPNDDALRQWIPLNLGLGVTEINFSVEWDSVTHTALAGSQDNGVIEQLGTNSTSWKDVSGGDGFFVAIGKSGVNTVRYLISNSLRDMERRVFSPGGELVENVNVKLANSPAGSPLSGIDDTVQISGVTDLRSVFRSIPLAVNSVNPGRLLLGRVFLYESADQSLGDVVVRLDDPSTGELIRAIAYGGSFQGQLVEDVIYVSRGGQIAVRYRDGSNALVWRASRPPGADLEKKISGIALDPENWMTGYAVDASHVWVTADGGVTWNDVTLNLAKITGLFNSIEVVRAGTQIAVLVGTKDGVYRLLGDENGLDYGWSRLGDNLPNVRVADIDYSSADDLLIVATTGRGVWTMNNVKSQIFREAALRLEGTPGNDEFLVRLQALDSSEPSVIEVLHQNVVIASVPLKSVLSIFVHTGDGDDKLILDNLNGAFPVPGNIHFDGGAGANDRLLFQGNYAGEVLLRPLGASDERRLDDLVVRTANVEAFLNAGILRSLAEVTGDGLRDFADWSRGLSGENLLGRALPIFGDSFGGALNGRQELPQPIGGARGESEAEAAAKKKKPPKESLFAPPGSAILRRLFETGSGAFLLDEIGRTLTTDEEIRQAFDDLDGIAGNVLMSSGNGETRFDISVLKTISGKGTVAIDALDGLFELNGELEVSADAALHLVLGVDAFGFFVDTTAVAGPELVLRGLAVNGMTASGRFGFLEVDLKNGSLATDNSVAISVNITEPGPDVYSGQLDGRIRLFELTDDPDSVFDVSVAGGGVQDLVLTAGFTVGVTDLGGEPLFDIGTATVKLTWPDINNPLRVRFEAVGGPAEILTRFLNFRPDEVIRELRRWTNYLKQLSSSALLDVELPFGGGIRVGANLDFSTAFIDDLFGKIAKTTLGALPGFGGALSSQLSLGKLSGDAKFNMKIGAAPPVPVTVTVGSMADNASLADLMADINAALGAAGISGKVHAALSGNQITFALTQGADLKVTGDPSNPFFAELGFAQGQIAIELPRLPTLQQLIRILNKELDPDGPEGPLTINLDPNYNAAAKEFTLRVIIGGIAFNKTAPFKYDPAIGLGELADVSFSGSLGLEVSLDMAFTLGFDLNAQSTPRMNTAFSVPSPSSGRLSEKTSFTLNLNDGTRFALPELTKVATGGNTKLADLVTQLNGLLNGFSYQGVPLKQVVRFVQAQTGNAIILEVINEDLDADGRLDHDEDANHNKVLDSGEDVDNDGRLDVEEDITLPGDAAPNGVLNSWLNKINSLSIEANANDPIFNEVGFSSGIARASTKGLFVDNVFLIGGLKVSASDLAAKARFAIFEISTSGGSATGQIEALIRFKNPHEQNPLLQKRIDLDQLLKHLGDISSYVVLSPAPLTGSVDIQLKHINISPNLPTLSGQPLFPSDAMVRIFIPDVRDLHYNAAPYNGSNTGVFVTYPQIGALGHFSCANYLEIISAIDSMSDQLEGLRGFGFLNEPLPLINTSLGGVLDFAGDLAKTFQKLFAGDAATISQLETDVESALGLGANQFTLRVDATPAPKTSGGTAATPATARFNPTGKNNAILLTATENGTALNDVLIDFVDDGTLLNLADKNQAVVSYNATAKVLTIRYNATYTTAAKVVQAITDAQANDPPFTAALDSNAATGDSPNNGTGVISETALKFHLEYGLSYGNLLALQLNLGHLVGLVSDPTVKSFLAGVADLIQVEGSANLNVTASATLALDFGLDVSSGCNFIPFLYDTTGLTLKAAVRGTNLNFKVGIGALNASIKNGSVTLDADGNPATTNDDASFVVKFKDADGDGRVYFRDENFFDPGNIDVSLTAGASAVLPLYALSSLPIGSTSDGNGDGYPDNSLVVKIPDLVELFTGDLSNSIQIITPNISDLFDDIDLCDLVTHADLLLDGLDALLGTIQDGLGSQVLSRNLPLVGPQLGKAADFIGDFRAGLLADMRSKLAEVGDPIGLVKQAIFEVLGKPGLDILAQMDGSPVTSFDQIDIVCLGSEIKFNFRLTKSLGLVDTTGDPIAFDIGIPGLGLEVNGNVKIEVSFDLKLKFAVSLSEGFYLDTSDAQELIIGFKVTIPSLHATGHLAFLQLDVSDESDGKDMQGNPRASSSFTGGFIVDLKDPVGSGDKLTFADMKSGLNFKKFVDAKLGAKADVNLDVAVSFGGEARFPRLIAELDVDWDWDPNGPAAGVLKFGMPNVALDIGSFVSDFIKPILKELRGVTEPLEPIVEVLTARLPVFSDLAGRDFTLLDMAELWGSITPETRKFIDVLAVVVKLTNDDSVANAGDLLLRLGGFNFDLDKFGKLARKAGESDGPAADLGSVNNGPFQAFFGELKKIGITLPFLSVGELFKLFTGKPVSFIEYEFPELDFEASFELVIPIIGPLVAKFGGSIHARADLAIGYDSFGLQKFFASTDRDPLHIFEGFYFKDVDDDGVDIAEILLEGALTASGSVDLVSAEAGVRGGLEATITANLNDPDADGRVRVSEIYANAIKDIRCIFDIHGELKAFFEAFLEVNLGFLQIDESFRLAEVTLLEFEIVCPEPVLATLEGASSDILRLNMGDFAAAREVGNLSDDDETFVVAHAGGNPTDPEGETVTVRFGGMTQTYKGVKKLYARAGIGNDVIDLRGVLAAVHSPEGIHGGPGNDTLFAGRGGGPFFGDAGDDLIVGEEAGEDFSGLNDEFHGGSGDDTLTGSDGEDQLFGDGGSDVIHGNNGHDTVDGGTGNDQLFGDDGDDMINGGDGADVVEGGNGMDTAHGDAGDDTINGGRQDDRLIGGAGDDVIDGGAGNDVILGDLGVIVSLLKVTGIVGAGNDLLAGGPGADTIFGAGGDDGLFGGTLLTSGKVQVSETDTSDFLDAGDGDDIVYADDAHSKAATTFPGANIGDSVWFDALDQFGQRNGIRDAGEQGVANLKVELFNSSNKLIATTKTDAAGQFRFVGLAAGDYYLKFTLPAGLDFTSANTGADDAIDSDADSVTGKTAVFHVDAGQSDLTQDAGVKGTTPVLTITSPSIVEGNTGVQNLVFTVSLSAPSENLVSVCYKTVSGTADKIVDYSSVDYTLVFEPGVTQLEILVPIQSDRIDERDETFTLVLDDPQNATLDPANHVGVGTIIDDDAPPVVSIADGAPVDADPLDNLLPPESAPVIFAVRLSNPSWQPIQLNYLTRQVVDGSSGLLLNDSARAGLDYTNAFESVPGIITFAPGETEKTFSIGTLDDVLDEYDELFQVVISLHPATPSDAATMGDESATGVIFDDEELPFVRWNPVVGSAAEGHAGNTAFKGFHILLTDKFGNLLPDGSGRPVTVSWNTAHGTAVSAAPPGELPDYVSKFETLTFKPADNQKQVEVEIIGDTRAEPNEYFFLNLLSAGNAQIGTTAAHLNHAVLTISNDESGDPGPWYVEFSSKNYLVDENAGKAVITLTRAEGSSEPAAVYWSLGAPFGGTATPGVDYLGVWENGTSGSRGKVFFEAGETARTFTIPVLDDDTYEGDETVLLYLRNPTGGSVRSENKVAVLTIRDNDPLPIVSIGNAHGQIGPDLPPGNFEGAGTTLLFDVTVSGKSSAPVKVDWAAFNGSALASSDFFAIGPVTLNFGPVNGVQKQTVQVTTKDDAVPEVMEWLYARLSDPVNAQIKGHEGIGYIADNDLATVKGFVFFDNDGNGHFDDTVDHPLPGVAVTLTDFQGPHLATTDAGGHYSTQLYLGHVTVAVDESMAPVGSEVSTGNNPQTVLTTLTDQSIGAVGFTVKPKQGKPTTSIGNGAAFFGDTAYGGSGDDLLDGGGGDDWLVGGHWLGPGCACDGDAYGATLLEQSLELGGRRYVDPASLPATGRIEGRVWLDATPDSLDDDGESGIGDVQVNLYDSQWALVATGWTDPSDGSFKFENLTACDYHVQFLAPAGHKFAAKDAGANDGIDSDASPLTGLTDLIKVVAGAALSVDAGLQPVPSGSTGPWSLQFDRLAYSVRESDGLATIAVSRTPNSFEPAGVFLTLNGTATSPADYKSIRDTLFFGANENLRGLTIPIVEDNLAEGYEIVLLFLRNPTGGPVKGSAPTAVLLIFDNGCPDNDTLYGSNGADLMLGDFGYFTGAGLPVLLGGMGHDALFGGHGPDQLHGQGGNDFLEGGADDDLLNGGGENDTYRFDGDTAQGSDTLVEEIGSAGGIDTIDFSATTNWPLALDLGDVLAQVLTPSLTLTIPEKVFENVIGGFGNDHLTGNELNNVLEGRAGSDTLVGLAGNDRLIGGAGDDSYPFDADAALGQDEIVEVANADKDLIDFSATSTQPIHLNLDDVVSQAVNPNLALKLSSQTGIENVYGGALADTLLGNTRGNAIQGREGNDTLNGGLAGYDILLENLAGNFTLTNTTLSLGAETDVYANFDEVSLVGDDNPNILDASAFTGTARLDGQGGGDTLIGGSGLNYLTGGLGMDAIDGSLGTDLLTVERDANLTVTDTKLSVNGAGEDDLLGIELARLTGGDGNNTLDASGFSGRAILDGGDGDDILIGTNQNDFLVAGPGKDRLRGGNGNDSYLFDADHDLGSEFVEEAASGGADTLDFSSTEAMGLTVHLGLTTDQIVNPQLSLTLSATDVVENLRGSLKDDVLSGNDLINLIEGLEGNDTITGLLGNDIVDGGAGLNEFGKPFRDTLVEARDAHFALANFALAISGGELDALLGIESARISGGPGGNILDASLFTNGPVTLDGAGGSDILTGGSGADTLTGGAGNDSLAGKGGDDTYVFDADAPLDSDAITEAPGEGSDTLNYSGTTTARISVNLGLGGALQIAAQTPTFQIRHLLTLSAGNVIENVAGGFLEDTLTGNVLDNLLQGGAGADWLTGLGGNDTLSGDDGDDTYFFDADAPLGIDKITEAAGAGGVDKLDFSATTTQQIALDLSLGMAQVVNPNLTLALLTCHSIENLTGGAMADTLHGNSLDNILEGLGGNDSLTGGMGDDTYRFDVDNLLGADVLIEDPDVEGGLDTLDFSDTATKALTVNLGSSLVQSVSNPNLSLDLSSGNAFENAIGGAQNDFLLGNTMDNTL